MVINSLKNWLSCILIIYNNEAEMIYILLMDIKHPATIWILRDYFEYQELALISLSLAQIWIDLIAESLWPNHVGLTHDYSITHTYHKQIKMTKKIVRQSVFILFIRHMSCKPYLLCFWRKLKTRNFIYYKTIVNGNSLQSHFLSIWSACVIFYRRPKHQE